MFRRNIQIATRSTASTAATITIMKQEYSSNISVSPKVIGFKGAKQFLFQLNMPHPAMEGGAILRKAHEI